ncbi:Heat stress transcription factor B-2a [Vanrija pseudolonga]|uniref:Heat stress transcription factor B-2a n=1 Tax=Vanrija pseudolonga TaxID=143232 RepID=A0AAF0Y6N9_9TREE|nr:Heat stress transcription factor B-2a [Vanrija pseudolonga]
MSRRGSTPEPRSIKRRHSLDEADESPEKRSRGAAEDDKSPRSNTSSLSEGSMAAGPSLNVPAASPHHSYPAADGPSEPRRSGNATPPSAESSPVSSDGDEGDAGDHSRSRLSASAPTSLRRPASSSGVVGRPSWQTMPRTHRPESEAPESRSWDRRGSNDPRDAQDHHEPLMTPRHVSLTLTPPTNFISSGSTMTHPPTKTQAAFVGKLYSMLEDEKIAKSRLLFWSEDGTSFVCPNPTEFSKDVLPNYFKHNNWQSFVRQLNMYSFNKVSDLYSTANSDPQAWEFRHPLFRRGEPNLLARIKRKSTRPSNTEGNNAPVTSPNDDEVRAAGGWAREGPHTGPSTTLQVRFGTPPRDYQTARQYPAYTHPPPAPTPYEPPSSSRVHFGGGGAPPSSSTAPASYPRDVREAAPSVEPTYFAPSQPSRQPSVESLSRQVAALQETVSRLHNSLRDERLQNSRTSIEFTNHLLHMAELFAESGRDTRGFQEVIHKQATLFRHRYDQLRAAELSKKVGHSLAMAPPHSHGLYMKTADSPHLPTLLHPLQRALIPHDPPRQMQARTTHRWNVSTRLNPCEERRHNHSTIAAALRGSIREKCLVTTTLDGQARRLGETPTGCRTKKRGHRLTTTHPRRRCAT